jgi:hypothetical protein
LNAAGQVVLYFILSMERTADSGACVWWRPQAKGYTTSIGEAGRYTEEEIRSHADPPHHLAIPCNAVTVPAARAKALAKLASKVSRFDVRRAGGQ